MCSWPVHLACSFSMNVLILNWYHQNMLRMTATYLIPAIAVRSYGLLLAFPNFVITTNTDHTGFIHLWSFTWLTLLSWTLLESENCQSCLIFFHRWLHERSNLGTVDQNMEWSFWNLCHTLVWMQTIKNCKQRKEICNTALVCHITVTRRVSDQ